MKLPRRFALRTLLLLMLVVAVVLGLVQWRRLWVIQEIKSLNEIGNCMDVSEPALRRLYARPIPEIHFDDGFWATVEEKRVPIQFFNNRVGTYSLAGDDREFEPEEFREFLADVKSRLHSVGVETVEFWLYTHRGRRLERKISTDLGVIK